MVRGSQGLVKGPPRADHSSIPQKCLLQGGPLCGCHSELGIFAYIYAKGPESIWETHLRFTYTFRKSLKVIYTMFSLILCTKLSCTVWPLKKFQIWEINNAQAVCDVTETQEQPTVILCGLLWLWFCFHFGTLFPVFFSYSSASLGPQDISQSNRKRLSSPVS